jgi:biotin carboxyl carrier protein
VVEIEDWERSPVHVTVNGHSYEVDVEWQGAASEATVTPEIVPRAPGPGDERVPTARLPLPPRPLVSEAERSAAPVIDAPRPGTIVEVAIAVGDEVQRGDEVCVLEAMKMRNSIKAPRAGRIAEILVGPGSKVAYGDPLIRFHEAGHASSEAAA